jgi:hypothetical protein
VVTFSMYGLRVKTVVCIGLDDGNMLLHHPLGVVVLELRYLLVSLHYHLWESFGPVSRHIRS